MTEDTSVRNLKSRFEGISLQPNHASTSKSSADGRPAIVHAKPILKPKPINGQKKVLAAESPKPLVRTETNDSLMSDPFGSPLNSPAPQDSNFRPPLPAGKPLPVVSESKVAAEKIDESFDAPSFRSSLHVSAPIDVARSTHMRPPPPPSPRIKSPKPSIRSSVEISRPTGLAARNIFADDLGGDEPDEGSHSMAEHIFDRLNIPPVSRPRTPASRPVSRPPSRNDSLPLANSSMVLARQSLDESRPEFKLPYPSPDRGRKETRTTPSERLPSQIGEISSHSALNSQVFESGAKPALPSRPAVVSQRPQDTVDRSPAPQLRAPQLPKRIDVTPSQTQSSKREVHDSVPRLPPRTNTISESVPIQTNTSRASLQHDRSHRSEVSSSYRHSTDTTHSRSIIHSSRNVDDSEDEDDVTLPAENLRSLEQPDSSTANRKPPRFKGDQWDILTGKEVRKTAISGDLLMVAHQDKMKLHGILTQEVMWQIPTGDTKVTAMDFRTVNVDELADAGRYLWVGFKDGSLHEFDIRNRTVVERYFHAHTGAIVAILRHGRSMWTLDELGNLQIWSTKNALSLKGRPTPITFRTVFGISAVLVVDGLLWIGSGRTVHVFDPLAETNHRLTPDRGLEPSRVTGSITCAVYLPQQPEYIYFGHDDGKITVYSRNPIKFIEILPISHYNLSALVSVGDYLWASFKTGKIFVYDVRIKPWRVMKEWHAHKSPIQELILDRSSLWREKRMQVASMAGDGAIKIWDGLLMDDWLDAELQKRVSEFSTFKPLSALICTWNAGASVPQKLSRDYEDSQFIENMIRQASSPDILVFGFQELVDLDNKGKASRSVAKNIFGKKKEKEPDEKAQAVAYQQWQNHLEKQVSIASSTQDGYSLLQVRNLVGLFTCLFVKHSIRDRIRNVEATVVKTGLKGRYGNKGGIVIRMTLDDTSLCFINCHLAAGQKHVMGRNNDVFCILDQAGLSAAADRQTRNNVFVNGGDGSMVLDHEICILNGDLNYRINGNRSQVLQNIREGRLSKLLENDQLLIELRKNATHRLRSFTESLITFPPTYKYDPGTDNYDSSEKMRIPAWCDRIYYRGLGSSQIEASSYKAHTCRVSDHRPVSVVLDMQVKTVHEEQRKHVREQVTTAWIELVGKTIIQWKVAVLKDLTGRSERECKDALRAAHGQAVSDAALALA